MPFDLTASLELTASQRSKLTRLATTLIDQDAARVIVQPQRPGTGHWFGGGNMVQDAEGNLWVVGRFRNQGDSRTGLGKGERGLELAIFCSSDKGRSFHKKVAFSKSDLNVGSNEVLSIEGTALRLTDCGVELFLSTEKSGLDYPESVRSFLKPGTGVWTVDRICAESIEALNQSSVEMVLSCDDPQFVQVKDPFLFEHAGQANLLFCTHPFCWSSSNTGYVPIASDGLKHADACFDFFPRGFTWDVAMTRGTAVMPVPKLGEFAEDDLALFFYDGGECVRDMDEHASAVKRPRGYSCEELGGVAAVSCSNLHQIDRLSVIEPMFISPQGTGCSRYVDVLTTEDGLYATWQQSQDDQSQPLVMNFVSNERVKEILQ